jgi:uncharacterized protein (DUF302 family)
MQTIEYGFGTTLENASFDETVERVTAALKEAGFGILTEIDVKATLKEKLDVDHRRYVILGACNPPLAHRALQADPQIGLLLPCNAVVQESASGRGIDVSFASPRAMFTFVKDPGLAPVAEDAEKRLRAALAAISGA